jgi:hypothetical protein
MKSSVKKGRLTAVLLMSAIGLAACGSDHDNDGPGATAPPPAAGTPPPAAASGVPAGAGASVAAYIAYLRGLKTDETSTPVSVGNFVAPVDDTAPATALGS